MGTLRVLDAIRHNGSKAKFYQASTSELYGLVQEIPQTEKTPFYPRSPYGVAKLAAFWSVVNYREAYNLFACNGILHNYFFCEAAFLAGFFFFSGFGNLIKPCFCIALYH